MSENLFDVLGVSADSTDAQVKSAWRAAVRAAHPDAGGSRERFDLVQRAYETLSTARGRATYASDMRAGAQRGGPESAHRASAEDVYAQAKAWAAERERQRARFAEAFATEPESDSPTERGKRATAAFFASARTWCVDALPAVVSAVAAMVVSVTMVVAGASPLWGSSEVSFNVDAWWIGSVFTAALLTQVYVYARRKDSLFAPVVVLLMLSLMLAAPYVSAGAVLSWWLSVSLSFVAASAAFVAVFLASRKAALSARRWFAGRVGAH